jgi:hypothetical protein
LGAAGVEEEEEAPQPTSAPDSVKIPTAASSIANIRFMKNTPLSLFNRSVRGLYAQALLILAIDRYDKNAPDRGGLFLSQYRYDQGR